MEKLTAIEAVNRFTALLARVRKLRVDSKRSGNGRFKPTDPLLQEADEVVRSLPSALGLSRTELLARLIIDRATFDRWRTLVSLPHQPALDRLRSIAEQGRASRRFSANDDGFKFASVARHQPWRLGVLLNGFSWDNVFLRLGDGNATISDGLLFCLTVLAFSKSSIVIIARDPTVLCNKLHQRLQDKLDKTQALLVSSKIGWVVEAITDERPTQRFCLLNYGSDPSSNSACLLFEDNDRCVFEESYMCVPPTDDVYAEIGRIYGTALTALLAKMDESRGTRGVTDARSSTTVHIADRSGNLSTNTIDW